MSLSDTTPTQQGILGVLEDQLSKTQQTLSGMFNGQTLQAYGNAYSNLGAKVSNYIPSITVSRAVTIIIGLLLILGGILALTKLEGIPTP